MSSTYKVKTKGQFETKVSNSLGEVLYSVSETENATNTGSATNIQDTTKLINDLISSNKIEIASINNPINPDKPDKMPDNNAIVIVLDQLVSYNLLPERVLKLLPGYQAFKKIGIEFTNNYNNRSTCTASRAVILTGRINTQIQDSMNSFYQSDIVPYIDLNDDTLGKAFKKNGYETRYIGKSHLDSRLYRNKPPNFSTNTIGSMRSYGYDTFDKIGDFDCLPKGLLVDAMSLQFINAPLEEEYDFFDTTTNTKQTGVIPYLRRCKEINKRFLCHVNFVNPHDTQESRSNLAQTKITGISSQFFFPFCEEQAKELNIQSPYYFDPNFKDAFVKNKSLVNNFFEKNYSDYKTIVDSLQNVPSYLYDYQTEPKSNSVVPFNIALNGYYNSFSTTPVNSRDVKSWKNFLNNYYCLIVEADSYIYKIYQELESLNLLHKTSVVITADHGEMMDAHGLRCKGYTYNECINIPFLISSPNLDPSMYNTKSDYLCSSIDLIPTLINLSKITYNNTQFTGESVFNTNANGKLVAKTKSEYPNKSVVTFVGGNDSFPLYFMYRAWQEATGNTENAPKSIINFGYMHTSVQIYLNNKLYKYGKYVSLKDWLEYTIKVYNIKEFTKQQIIDNTTSITKDIVINALKEFSKLSFTLEELYSYLFSKLSDDISPADYIILISATLAVIKIVDDYTKRLYYIPGCYENFEYNKNKYSLFCYNMTDDKDEVVNLLDVNHYNPSNNALFEQLNTILNSSTDENKMNPIFYISPYQVLIDTIENVKLSIVTGLIDYFKLSNLTIESVLEVSAKEFIRNDN